MKKSVFKAISMVAVFTLIAKGLGMVRDILQARAFGTSSVDIDLFTMANNSTIYLFTTAAYALCLAAIPIFSQKKSKSSAVAVDSANNLISITLLFSLVVTGLMLGAVRLGLFGSGVGESGYRFEWYAGVMCLALPLIVLTYLLMALFQAMGHYSLQGSLSLLYNVVICGLLFAAGKRMTVPMFAVVMTAAWVLQFVMVLPSAIKERYQFRFRLNFKAPELRTYLRTALVTAFTTSAFLLCYLTDTRQSAMLGVGVTAAFSYADKLFTPIVTTLIYSIGAVIFPKWSENYTTMDKAEYRSYVGKVVENTVVLLMPLSVIFSVFGVPIIRVLFEGGSFTAESSAQTGGIFACYMLGMIGFSLLDLFSKAFYATGKTGAPLLVNAGVVLLNGVLNAVLVKVFAAPVVVAGATSLCLTVGGMILAGIFFKGQLKSAFSYKKVLIGVAVSGLLYGGLSWLTNAVVLESDSKILLIVKCGIMGGVALLIYFVAMHRQLQLNQLLKREKN